jgi:hypothetical protein
MINTTKALAIANALLPTQESVYRNFCRRYSVAFHTPLSEVFELSPEHVILNVFEHEMDDLDLDEHTEDLLHMIYQIEDPEYDDKVAQDVEDFIMLAEEEEKKRLAQGRRIGQKVQAKPKIDPIPPEMPTSGGLNLAYLEKLDNER